MDLLTHGGGRHMDHDEPTRRQLLGRGGTMVAGLGVAGTVGRRLPDRGRRSGLADRTDAVTAPGPHAAEPGALVQHFVSRPDLRPPVISVSSAGPEHPILTPPYVLLSPRGYPLRGPGQPGLMILDRHGQVVWFRPSGRESCIGLAAQTYRGAPVLTWWQGTVANGHGRGAGVIADDRYATIATVRAGNGLMADLHEFAITPQNTALITAYRTREADLTAIKGPASGFVLSGVAQEIDIATGKVLFQWDSLDHVPVTETLVPLSGGTAKAPFDYFHINSLAIAPDGDLLVSARNTCTVYKVSRQTGDVAWRLGGRQSSFALGAGARFYFQHHVRPHGPAMLSLFDDGGSPPRRERQSRAILLDLDSSAMSAKLHRAYTHPVALAAANQGSMQVLPEGRVFVGWGNEPYFSEFSASGDLRMDGRFPGSDQSYRAFRAGWAARPEGRPAAAARADPACGTTVYASWNGATDIASWVVRSGRTRRALAQAGRRRRTGFETAITVRSAGPYFAVTAHDSHGRVLGTSAAVRVQRTS